jgi:hypothetical protein
MVKGQHELEARYLSLIQKNPPPEATIGAIFGPMEDWILAVGRHKLLLMPGNGEWALWDPLHQSWEHTGLGSGEVDFGLEAGRLVIQRRPGAPPLRADLGEDRWFLRSAAGSSGPFERAEILRQVQGRSAAVRRVGTPVWLRAEALFRAEEQEERGVATLQVMSGREVGRQIPLEERTLLGKWPGCTVQLDDNSLSAIHTEIQHRGGNHWQIRHLGGPGGTWRNGELIQGWESLHSGDKVAIGRYNLIFHQLKADQ